MARISSGSGSKQDYQTPKEFISACIKRFGLIGLDLAAHAGNHVVPCYIAPCTGPDGPQPFDPQAVAMDTFDQDWAELHQKYGRLWLNPPFSEIGRFAERCCKESEKGAEILLLIPYGTTAAFNKYVLDKADLYMLKGRLQFIEGESFPKDCLIAHYSSGVSRDNLPPEIKFWDWKKDEILKTYTTRRDANEGN